MKVCHPHLQLSCCRIEKDLVMRITLGSRPGMAFRGTRLVGEIMAHGGPQYYYDYEVCRATHG